MAAPNNQLTMRSGPTPGKTYQLNQEETIVGRDLANDIAISDPEVSRHHARFMIKDENILIEDLGSTNGTFLNGERISNPQQLRPGDVITLGENVVMVLETFSYDPDATIASSQDVTPEPTAYRQQAPMPQSYQSSNEPADYEQIDVSQQPVPVEEEKGGFPTWLIILIIAIVVIVCVIAVTLWFMPASWWCALTLDMLEGCPIQ